IRASSSSASSESQSLYVATSAEVDNNWITNCANRWYKPGLDADEVDGDYAFQRLRRTWFSPRVVPKFKLHPADKFYAIGSCFARGIENALAERRIVVESAAAEFADLQPVNKDVTG